MSKITANNVNSFPRAYFNSDKRKMAGETTLNKGNSNEKGVDLYISNEGKERYLALKEYDQNSFLKLDETFFRKDYHELRRLDFANSIAERTDLNPLENEFQISGVTYIFNEGTLEDYLSKTLEGKVENPSLMASEISAKVRGSVNNKSGSVEERGLNREVALKFVAYLAENYFNDKEEGNDFFEKVNQSAERDILREKGYIVFDNSNMKPFKSYSMANAPEDYINLKAYAEKYGNTDLKEIFSDSTKLKDFMEAIKLKGGSWREEIVREFADNERSVENSLKEIKNSLNHVRLDQHFIKDMEDSLREMNNHDAAKWTTNLLNLLL
ncbi:hypothetical protein [Alkaliphilus transvaalensis]|uniref:hypothetical protein n=1 Tax=Alkaliphilus transvaalensis TaxID=114628 RepID=UPI0006858A05|nr:hypothetical protein [Alkaliphilus transvaalensis]